ncbi:MAG: hypothetical protein ACI934_000580, partial [Pseudohongiellaceae bacterium]
NVVDTDFLIEQLIAQAQGFVNVPEDQLRANYEDLSTNRLTIQAAVSIAILIPLIMVIYSGYLSLISKFTYDEIRFKQWFSLSAWTGLPVIFAALAGWVVILTNSDGMIATSDIQPLSLNTLIFHTEGPFSSMLSNLNLIQIWSLALSTFGYQQWTGKTLVTSATIVVGPYVLIYGIWSIIILT